MKEENKIIIKRDGQIMVTNHPILTDKKPYITKKEQCFQDIINDSDFKNACREEILDIKQLAEIIVLGFNVLDDCYLTCSMSELKRVTNKDELINILLKISRLGLNTNKNFDEIYGGFNQDLAISIVVKKFVNYYYETIISKLSSDSLKLDFIQIQHLNGTEKTELFALLGEDIPEEAFDNGMFTLCYNALNDQLNKTYLSKQQHLCSDCPREFFYSCPKITDRLFQGKDGYAENMNFTKIEEYSFIENGIEIIDSNGKLDSLIISKCKRIQKK